MRLLATRDVWVYWERGHLRDVSHVRDLSFSGLFLETDQCRPKGESTSVYFLVPEGRICLQGAVTRVESDGLALKFKSITHEDIPRLTALISRIRFASRANPPTEFAGRMIRHSYPMTGSLHPA